MTTLLWIVGYLVVGFVVAVFAYRLTPSPTGSEDNPATAAFFGFTIWPFYLPLTLFVWVVGRIAIAIVWCARRLP